MVTRRFDMPPGVDSSGKSLASACVDAGYPRAIVNVECGKVTSASLFDEDGRHVYARQVDGNWLEFAEAGGSPW